MNLLLLNIFVFVIGLIELFFWSLQTKALVRDRILNTFIFTFISGMIWFIAVSQVAENINKILLMISYSTGCGIGAILTIKLDKVIDKIARAKLWKRKKKHYRTIKKK
jgi:uncharacterized protein YebE (UPF0316 family)